MAGYKLSSKAAVDLEGIYQYTILNFGLKQAQNYLNGLHARFANLADHPALGSSADQLAPALRRYEYQSHVVFYKPAGDSVLIVRVLHESMDFPRHL